MPTLLAISCSPRGPYSTSRKLTEHFVAKWSARNHDGRVVVRDVSTPVLPFVDLPWIAGAFTPPETHSPEVAAAIEVSNELVSELNGADHIVLGLPMYNFSIPASLKAYVDHVVRIGVTVGVDNKGLITGKRMTTIMSSGGDYTPGSPAEGYNVAIPYLRQVFGFIGITDMTVVLAGGSRAVDQGELTLEAFAARYDAQVAAAVA
ncbi:MAG: FMN-dependent NADH-azoreductase [Janthinobacterium lividum]